MNKPVALILTFLIILILFTGCTDNGSGPIKGNIYISDKEGKIWLTKEDFQEVSVNEKDGNCTLLLTLTDAGRRKMKEATQAVYPRTGGMNVLDIYVDDDILASPIVYEEIDSSDICITSLTKEKAISISKRLRDAATAVITVKPTPAEIPYFSEEKPTKNPDDILYLGTADMKKYVKSAKVELTLSKDLMSVTSVSILFTDISYTVELSSGPMSVKKGSVNVVNNSVLPIVNGFFTLDMGEGFMNGKINANGNMEGTLRYIDKGIGTNQYTFDFGEWPWTAEKANEQ